MREAVGCLLCGRQEAEPFVESAVQLAPATGERFRFVRCRNCGLVYLNPRPAEGEIGRYYPPEYLPHRGPDAWGRWAPLVRASERRLDRTRVTLVRRHAEISDEVPALDVGCGRATFLRLLTERTGAPAVGLDPNPAGWTRAAADLSRLRLVEGSFPSAESAVLDALRDMRPDGSDPRFGLITLWHALEHDYRPLDTLRLLRRLARPDALLVIEVPDLSSWSARLQGSGWAGLHTPRHTAAYSRRTLRAMLEAAGWTVERQLRHGTLDPWVLWWLGRRAGRGDSLSGPLEPRFPGFLAGKALSFPIQLTARWVPLGIQTALARAPSRAGPG